MRSHTCIYTQGWIFDMNKLRHKAEFVSFYIQYCSFFGNDDGNGIVVICSILNIRKGSTFVKLATCPTNKENHEFTCSYEQIFFKIYFYMMFLVVLDINCFLSNEQQVIVISLIQYQIWLSWSNGHA